uniref:Uncharacterized protein n=1 Tax=Biomphalaria glabrata TaxID=6526 RepID=A0A2C9LVB7_BIOGL
MSQVIPQDINVAVLGQRNHRQQYAPPITFSESLLGVDNIKSHTGYRFCFFETETCVDQKVDAARFKSMCTDIRRLIQNVERCTGKGIDIFLLVLYQIQEDKLERLKCMYKIIFGAKFWKCCILVETDGPKQKTLQESNTPDSGSTTIAQDLLIMRMRLGDDEEYVKSQKELISEICKHGKTNPYQKHDFDNVEVRKSRELFVVEETKRKYENEIKKLKNDCNYLSKREALSATANLMHRISKENKELYKDVLKDVNDIAEKLYGDSKCTVT